MDSNIEFPDGGVIFGHRPCQTRDAKWLLLENVFEKCCRPNMYDIGGTYIEDLPHFWFYYKVEIVGKVYLLHIFVTNRREGTFHVSLSNSSVIAFKKKQKLAYLTAMPKTYKFEKAPAMSQNYLKTYSFSEIDLETLKDLKLYIPVSFDVPSKEKADQHDFRALLDDPYGSDFVIESQEGDKFNVHKVFLQARSDVFTAMLKENTAESQQSYLKLIDIDKHDLFCMLEYIYTGTLQDISSHNFFNLLMLSDRYNLQGLREISEYSLSNQICAANVIETFVAADLYNAETLKIAALKFMKCNKNAIHNRMFDKLDNVQLIREICQFLLPQ
ncbi:BTB and MATH domain-containing protein 43-like [Pararge aegeria]|uniref:Roadkill n=1 Tax=Pararge aegeria TaxID=116150 RepID=S4PBF8_9NEOP|nr:BTB and MATH domain-containing protein 43-like [Pararge aegeria]